MLSNYAPGSCMGKSKDFELVNIEKTKAICAQCEKATEVKAQTGVPMAIISCEGACLRGEISRRVANAICFKEMPEQTFRVCLGGAFTKDTNQRKLVNNSGNVIALEGCGISCATRMIKGVLPNRAIQTILVNRFYKVDPALFALNDLSEEETAKLSAQVTEEVLKHLCKNSAAGSSANDDQCYC